MIRGDEKMKVVKYPDGNYYVCRVRPNNRNYRTGKNKTYSNKFFPKFIHNNLLSILFNSAILFPNEFIGKKIRFKVEVIEDETEKGSITISKNDN